MRGGEVGGRILRILSGDGAALGVQSGVGQAAHVGECRQVSGEVAGGDVV